MTTPVHTSLANHVADAADLYGVLVEMQVETRRAYGYRWVGTVGLLACGFLLPGAWGATCFCLAAMGALATLQVAFEFFSRSVLLDVVTLHEVIRPRGLLDQLSFGEESDNGGQ